MLFFIVARRCNITLLPTGLYFNKVQCFCFEQQRLKPREQVDMPVSPSGHPDPHCVMFVRFGTTYIEKGPPRCYFRNRPTRPSCTEASNCRTGFRCRPSAAIACARASWFCRTWSAAEVINVEREWHNPWYSQSLSFVD